jgi:hypothetical protein
MVLLRADYDVEHGWPRVARSMRSWKDKAGAVVIFSAPAPLSDFAVPRTLSRIGSEAPSVANKGTAGLLLTGICI